MTWLSTVRPPHVYLVCTKYWTYGIVLYIYKLTSQFDRLPITLLEKQSKFPRYNMKCRIFCAVSRFPHHISCYIAESRLPLGQCSLDMKVQFVRWGGKCVELLHRAGHAQKWSKCPRYNTECRGKPDTTRNIPHSISFSPRYISCYIAENRLSLWLVHRGLTKKWPSHHCGWLKIFA